MCLLYHTFYGLTNEIYCILSTGAINTIPVPLYKFTKPSPEAADPTRVFLERSTVNSSLPLHAIARLPSIYATSFSNSTSINSSCGHGDSRQRITFPSIPKLTSPAFPAIAD